ncbi:MAG: acetate kinase [Planctomycetota bacterium]|nr:MAG: acetate kinase [Planctomycetota bacterium]
MTLAHTVPNESATILVCNCGSSSIKFAVVQPSDGTQPISGIAECLGSDNANVQWRRDEGQRQHQALAGADHGQALQAIVAIIDQAQIPAPLAVGHRVVHGGDRFTASALLDAAMLQEIQAVSHLAPLHNPANLEGIAAAQAAYPSLPQVAVFDTAFHQTMPQHAYRYAVPEAWYRDHGVRRYGFHGTSHRFVAHQAAMLLDQEPCSLALVTAHLGNGCSAAAVLGGQAVDTSMGLTPLEGLVMGTRSGDIDPGIIAFMAQRLGRSAEAITNALNKESGLLGLSDGLSNDMRQLVEARDNGHPGAALAIDVFCYRLAKHIAGLAVAMGRLDAVVFTGGIGENAVPIRSQVLSHLHLFDIQEDPQRNARHGAMSNGRISQDDGGIALVVPTNEELQIARETLAVVREAEGESA